MSISLYRYHTLRKVFFPSSIIDIMNWFQKFNVGFKSLLHQILLELKFYGDIVYKSKMILCKPDFLSVPKVIIRDKRIGYDLNVMRQSACFMINQSRLITMLHS